MNDQFGIEDTDALYKQIRDLEKKVTQLEAQNLRWLDLVTNAVTGLRHIKGKHNKELIVRDLQDELDHIREAQS